MKLLVVLGLLLSSLSASAATVIYGGVEHRFTSVLNIVGEVNRDMLQNIALQLSEMDQSHLPLVYIDSPGGYLSIGQDIIDLLKMDKKMHPGEKLTCYVHANAHSMAFNILTNVCDVRIASSDAQMVVHKAAGMPDVRPSAKNLRKVADEIDAQDAPYRLANAKAMHLSLKDYDTNADKEREWTSFELLGLHYLDAIGSISF